MLKSNTSIKPKELVQNITIDLSIKELLQNKYKEINDRIDKSAHILAQCIIRCIKKNVGSIKTIIECDDTTNDCFKFTQNIFLDDTLELNGLIDKSRDDNNSIHVYSIYKNIIDASIEVLYHTEDIKVFDFSIEKDSMMFYVEI